MPTENVVNWTPVNKDDIALKKALIILQESADSVLLSLQHQKEEDKREKKFLLQIKNYFALKAYVLTGKDFPTNHDEFNRRFPGSAFKRLLPIDARIFEETRQGLVAVGSLCRDFYDTKLQNLVSVGSLAVVWSRTTLECLKGNQGMSLHSQLMVLSNPKYTGSDKHDDEFREALDTAHGFLELLQHEAEDGQRQADNLIKDLVTFRDSTERLRPAVEYLIRKYTAGDKPYLSYLNEEYQKSSASESQKFEECNGGYDGWKDCTGLAVEIGVSVSWVPILGWVSLTASAHNGDRLRHSWVKLSDEYQALKEDSPDEALLIESMNKLSNQFKGLREKIDDAIKAVRVLSVMFRDQTESYQLIGSSLSGMGNTSNKADAETRNWFIRLQIEGTCRTLDQLQKAAEGFIKDILNETTLG